MDSFQKIYSRKQNSPLIVALFYFAATVALSVVGPMKYFNHDYKYVPVLFFMAGICFLLTLGYLSGKMAKPAKLLAESNAVVADREGSLIKWSLVLSLISLGLELGYLISIGHFSLSPSELGNVYTTAIDNNSTLVILIRILSSFFRMTANIVGIYRFKELARGARALVVANVVAYLLVFLFGYGNQKGVSDVVIYIAVAVYVNRLRRGAELGGKAMRLILPLLMVMLLLFSYMQYLRYSPRGIDASNYHLYSTGEFYFDTNHPVFKVFGSEIGFGMATILSGYLSQGYYGLSLCLQLPFEWTYGLGSSYALTKILERVGIAGIYDHSYLNRMSENFGRDGLSAWNTIFPWLASDYTWLGALVFFFFVGNLLARAWREVLVHDNIISYLMLVNLIVLILFVPANNQLFHGYDSFIASWSILVLWGTSRSRYMRRNERMEDEGKRSEEQGQGKVPAPLQAA